MNDMIPETMKKNRGKQLDTKPVGVHDFNGYRLRGFSSASWRIAQYRFAECEKG
jgi:hypothetical protein